MLRFSNSVNTGTAEPMKLVYGLAVVQYIGKLWVLLVGNSTTNRKVGPFQCIDECNLS